MPNFYIFSMCWGNYHVGLFKKAVFRSLNWPKNQAALNGKTWRVFTKREHFKEFEDIFKGSVFNLELVEVGELMKVAGVGLVKTTQCDAGVLLLNGLRDQMSFCLQSGQKLLLAPPDTIFGDGSVNSMLQMGKDPYTCVFVAHPRVLPEIMETIEYKAATEGALSNAQLVGLALKHPHESFVKAEIGVEGNTSYVGGIAWRRLGGDDGEILAVQHRLPTPYFIGFHPFDFDFWWSSISFGALDHSWPGDRMIRQERARYIGASDAAFIVEITDARRNVPPKPDYERIKMLGEDAYWGDRIHHSVNRGFVSIWRSV